MKERLFSFFKMNRLIPVILCLFFATSIYAQNREVKGMTGISRFILKNEKSLSFIFFMDNLKLILG